MACTNARNAQMKAIWEKETADWAANKSHHISSTYTSSLQRIRFAQNSTPSEITHSFNPNIHEYVKYSGLNH